MELTDHTKFELAAAAIADGQTVRMPLKGGSMRPLLREGRDTVVLGPLRKPLRRGKVYLFEYQGRYILHRLVRHSPTELTFRGEHNAHCEHTHPDAVRGMLVGVERNGKKLNVNGLQWQTLSTISQATSSARRATQWLCRGSVRRTLWSWYLVVLAVLMWAPLNGLGVPLDNFVLGIRADHLLHASVYLPCVFLWVARCRFKHLKAWIISIFIALTTECVQYLLPYRGFDVNDMIANILGVSTGLLVTYLFDRRHPRFATL